MTRRAVFAVAAAPLLAAVVPARPAAQGTVDFRGRVYDAASKTGVQNLEVKLTPPRQVKIPARIARTDRDGVFAFPRLVRGRYLLEVSQGVSLLYRAELDATSTDSVEVPLRRR